MGLGLWLQAAWEFKAEVLPDGQADAAEYEAGRSPWV